MLHSNFREYEKAVYYGKLAVRAKTQDHLHYVNNLCAVLLRLEKNQEALELMQGARIEGGQYPAVTDDYGLFQFELSTEKNSVDVVLKDGRRCQLSVPKQQQPPVR